MENTTEKLFVALVVRHEKPILYIVFWTHSV